MFYDYTSERNKVRNEGISNKIHFVEHIEKEKRESEEEAEDNADILSTENLNNVLRVLEAKAAFSGNPPKELHLRVAKYDNGSSILYDLTNTDWQVVKVT
jgi:hypothetical protein